ncbi:MAG: insulinase family protein [Spirosomaceae bacterium]|jgi:predicted Zn-dependent peptidase|nr:insulinase family protein [Spirosomataceae bacterium]
MQLDRTIAPDFHAIQGVHFPSLQQSFLDNKQPLYVVNIGQQPVVRVEVLFEAGTWHEQCEGASFFAVKMLSEGTKKRTSIQISEALDQVGAFLELSHTPDRANVVVYGLPKHLPVILAVLTDLLTEASFPEKEFENLRNITLQNLRINLEKNAFVASSTLKGRIFGEKHPYGLSQNEEAIRALKRDDLEDFYEKRIKNRPFRVFLSGQVTDTEVALVNRFLGQHSVVPPPDIHLAPVIQPQPEALWIEKADALQSSIRVGRRLVTRQHPDFYQLVVANELLGGYFGSRLMRNIREEKGFTYGISSSLIPMRRDGYWTIGTDVKKEFLQATLTEIEKEIERLQQDLVPDEELDLVKNYMAGAFAGSLNTPFEIADRVRLIVLEGLDVDFYSNYIQRLRVVSAAEVRYIAQKYWQWGELQQVVVG